MDRDVLINRTLHKPILAKGQKIRDIYGTPAICKTCKFTVDRHDTYTWGYHYEAVVNALESEHPSPMTLVGTATSPTGRSIWRLYIHNIYTKKQLPYDHPKWWGSRDFEGYKTNGKRIIKALKADRRWKAANTGDLWGRPWVAVVKSDGDARVGLHLTRIGALSNCLYVMAKQESKGFRIDFDLETPEGVSVTPILSVNTMISDLVDRSRKASSVAANIRRLNEIDEVLDNVEVLKHVRSEVQSRLIL